MRRNRYWQLVLRHARLKPVQHHFNGFVLDLATRELLNGETIVHVERQVFDVLEVLIENADRVLGKAELLDTVWGDQFVSESALTSRIKSARQALGDDGRSQRFIKTIHGVGYRFVAPLSVPPQSVRAAPTTQQGPTTSNGRPNVALTIGIDDDFPFVGRDAEADRVWDMITDGSGQPGAWLVGGAAGVGKSRLSVEMAERAAARLGAVVGAGRCDRDVAGHLQAWRDIVHQLATAHPDDFRRWCLDLEETIAVLGPAVAHLLGQEAFARPIDEHAASEAIVALLDRVSADRPTVLVIDDLHWSDEPTRATLALLLRRLGHRPVFVFATFRTSHDDLPREVELWLADLARSSRVERLDLVGLDHAAVRDLTTRVLGTDAEHETTDLFDRTGGHGLFVTELLREIQRGGTKIGVPQSVTGLVSSRLVRLPSDAQDLVMAGAALGVEFRIATVAAVAELTLADALAALDAAIQADLIHEGTSVERFRFSHQLVPVALLDRLTGPARAGLHYRCVAALTDELAAPTEVAMHLLESVPLTPRDEAVATARGVAWESFQQSYYDQALRLLERILEQDLDEETRAEIELEQGTIMNDAGLVPEAIPIFDRAAERARATDRTDLLVRAAFGRAGRSPYRRIIDTGTLELLDEIGQLPDLDEVTKARALARTAAFQLNWWRFSERDDLSATALETGRAAGASGQDLLELVEARWIAVGCPAGAHELDKLDAELARLRAEIGVPGADAGMPETAALWSARGDEFRREAANFIDVVGERRSMDYWRHDVLNGTVAVFEGRFDEAATRFDEAGHRARACWGEAGAVLHAFAHLTLDAVSGSERSAPLLNKVAQELPSPIVHACQAWGLELSGDRQQARTILESIDLSSPAWFPEHLVGGASLVAAAEVAVVLDYEPMVNAVRRQLEPLGSLMLGLPWAPSVAAADSLALLAHYEDDVDAEAKWRQQAVAVYEALDAPALSAHLSRI